MPLFTAANITMKLEKYSAEIEGTNVTQPSQAKNQSLTSSNATTVANITSNSTSEQ